MINPNLHDLDLEESDRTSNATTVNNNQQLVTS